MAKFTTVVRSRRSDGLWPVFIRVSHGAGKIAYIKTQNLVSDKGLKKSYSKNGAEKLEVSEPKILRKCNELIISYATRLNVIEASAMTVQEIVSYLTTTDKDVNLSFTDYAEKYVTEMIEAGRANSADNYKLSVNKLHEFMCKKDIKFEDLTANIIQSWIDSMKYSARKKNLYPTCIKTIYKAAMLAYNDEDRDIIRIRKNPFDRVKIPSNKSASKRSKDIKTLKSFFNAKIREEYQGRQTKESLAQDVCKIIFCLAGINAADLYDLPKDALKDGYLRFNRKKTRDKSATGAYTEIKIPAAILPLMTKYKGKKKLFCFSERYSVAHVFSETLAMGCRRICNDHNIEKITPYTFRHSWSTIARNDCNATMDDIALALIHESAHKTTGLYITVDYTRIDKINEKVIKKVFGKQ